MGTVHTIYCLPDRPEEYREPRKSRAFRHLQSYAEGHETVLWDWAELEDFVSREDAALWRDLRDAPRGIMMVDVLRWLVVYRFGGMYIQLGTAPLRPIGDFFPGEGKSVRLFTECELTSEQCRAAECHPIRGGRPEEPVRIPNQVFAAEKGAPFAGKMVDFLVERLRTMTPREDYDVLYITANAAVSEGYDRFGKGDPGVERMGLEETRRMVKLKYTGAWRTDPEWVARRAERAAKPAYFREGVQRNVWVDWGKSFYYRLVRRHPHEELFGRLAAEGRLRRDVAVPEADLRALGIRRSVSLPGGTGGGRFVNLMQDAVPKADLLLFPDYFEWLPFREIQRIWARLPAGRFRYAGFTHCPLLDDVWDTALGDFRPLNFRLEPFGLPEPAAAYPCGGNGRRTDRQLALWPAEALRKAARNSAG